MTFELNLIVMYNAIFQEDPLLTGACQRSPIPLVYTRLNWNSMATNIRYTCPYVLCAV